MNPRIFAAIMATVFPCGLAPPSAQAQPFPTYAGFNYVAYYNGAYENADSLAAMIGTGANATALTVEYGIDVQSSEVYADPSYTESLNGLGATIAEAKGRGLTVMVRPLIDFLDPSRIGSYRVGDWRSLYNPTDSATFFASYKTMIVNLAQVAQANGATLLCIGAELDQLTGPTYQSYWTDVIGAVRAVFSGKLTYAADWDDDISPWQGQNGLPAGTGNLVTQVSFWSELDYLGIDEYAPISDTADPVLADLVTGWTQTPSDQTSLAVTGNQSLINYFDGVAVQTGLPLLFTEIGYESASDAAKQPSGTSINIYDPALQANLYAAFFDAWRGSAGHSLAGVFFWVWDPNAAEVGPGNGANFSPQNEPAQNAVSAGFAERPVNGMLGSTRDFNGDGFSDILWLDTGGDPGIWFLSGETVASQDGLANVGVWSVAGTGDFNGDRISDILWRDASGDLAIWLMSGSQILSGIGLGQVPTVWSIVGVGDFNGDGMSDILWLDAAGDVGVWLMNGTQVSSCLSLGNVGTAWSVVGTGDFDGDGTSDILWRNNSTGELAIWLMHDGQSSSGSDFGRVPLVWSVVGTGDFDGDGTTDILWRNTSTGDLAIWFMSGGQFAQGANLGQVPLAWSVSETGDFNDDGKSDILWRDSSGKVAVWLMNGAQMSSGAALAEVPAPWIIQSANGD